MAFPKRTLTWNEEVLAGLAVLVLVVAGVSIWFLADTSGVGEQNNQASSEGFQTLTDEDKIRITDETSNMKSPFTAEQKAAIMANDESSGNPYTEEDKERILAEMQMP